VTLIERTDDVNSCWRDLADVLKSGISRVLLYGPSERARRTRRCTTVSGVFPRNAWCARGPHFG